MAIKWRSPFGYLGLHLNKLPSGRYTFVGSVPAELCEYVLAGVDDVMGGRSVEVEGRLVTPKVRVFDTAGEARKAATAAGYAFDCVCCRVKAVANA